MVADEVVGSRLHGLLRVGIDVFRHLVAVLSLRGYWWYAAITTRSIANAVSLQLCLAYLWLDIIVNVLAVQITFAEDRHALLYIEGGEFVTE